MRVRTGYSFRQACGHLPDVMERLKVIEAPVAPISDRASTFAFHRWSKLAKQNGLRPVYGVELAVSPSVHAKKPATDMWLFFARQDVSTINRLVELSTQQFRYQPLLSIQQAFDAAKDCVVVVGHRAQLNFDEEPPEGVYLGLSPATPRGLLRKAVAAGWPLVGTSDNRYPCEGDHGFYETLVGRNAETQTYPQWLLSRQEWIESVSHHDLYNDTLHEIWDRGWSLLEGCTAELKKASLPIPPRPASLREMCEQGAKELGVDLSNHVYADRLARELEMIRVKGYDDYFYIVADLCIWARKNMLVGPARGSSCGSLVCYLLKITTIDPIPHGLIFERFIDVNRDDMPDIDIDFSDQRRHLVFDYMNKIYGADHVARLGTVAMYKPRSALQEVGTALRVPKYKCDAVAESLIERSSGDSRAMNTLEDTLMAMPAGKKLLADHPEMKVVTRFEGHPRHYGQHAAGVVVASNPITDYVAIDHRTGATMCDKKDAEEGYNLLKIDALGLTQLSVFEDALDLAGLPRDTLFNVDLEDPAAFEVLNEKRYSGIFQFNGMALQSVVQQFKVTEFNDIVSVTALARPGPLASGGANEWVMRKNGQSKVSYPHPIFEPYMKDTLGVVLYQEQVMEIGRHIGDLDWGQVTALRKAMSKSLGVEFFNQFGDPWKKAAIAKGVDAEKADQIWDDLCAYGSWSFNKSHATAYGLMSYWCCWLKAHHPFEFAAATLTHERLPTRQIQVLREMTNEGIDYVPVDPKESTDKWTIGYNDGKRVLIGPLWNVHGIGPKMVTHIMANRSLGVELSAKAQKLLRNAETDIDSLWPVRDAFDRLLPNPEERNIFTPPTPIGKLELQANDQNVLLFCTFTRINPRDENEAVKIAQRGYEITDGKTASLNLHLTDDTGMVFGKISRWDYQRLAPQIIDRGRVGKALYAVKGVFKGHGGNKNQTFRMVLIQNVRYIGDITDEPETKTYGEQCSGSQNAEATAAE